VRGARLVVAGLGVVLALAVAGAALAAHLNYPDVEAQYMCVTCNIPLQEAESDQAAREKAFLHRLVDEGDSEAQIKRKMVFNYGERVLQLPPRSGFNLVAYIVPVAVVVVLVGALLAVLPRWRRRSVEVPGALALPDADNVRLDADLARFDR
jgi:cytochrome c-type biogenesis protein CcmH/NrfF